MKHACPKCGRLLHKWEGTKSQSGKPRWYCRDRQGYCYSTVDPAATGVRRQDGRAAKAKPVVFKRSLKGTVRFLVTAAQNATPVHDKFIKSLEAAAHHLNAADIVVVPLRYKNPTSRWTDSQANAEEWAPEVQPYLCNQRKKLNKSLVLLADIKTQPTATSPLTGFDAITHGESGILGHTKLQFRTVPTPQHRLPKILTTTGACTVDNYTDSKAGKLGEFHHTLGACMVEVGRSAFHLRQINASKEDGSFIDLATQYGPIDAGSGTYYSAQPAERAAALDMGDLHADSADPAALQGTREQIALLQPKKLIWHDVDDAHTITPHHKGNPFAAIAKVKSGRTDPEAELYRSIDLIAEMTPDDTESVVVFSNHPEMLARWIRDTDWKHQPGNAEFYLKTALMMAEQTRLGSIGVETPDPFIYWGRKYAETLGKNIRFLDLDESFTVLGIEAGMHGHRGPNGARGSIKNLRRIGVKSLIGHGHGPGIDEGCMQVGTLTALRAEYTAGPGGWLNSNGVVYANGKRSLLNIINGEWRLS